MATIAALTAADLERMPGERWEFREVPGSGTLQIDEEPDPSHDLVAERDLYSTSLKRHPLVRARVCPLLVDTPISRA